MRFWRPRFALTICYDLSSCDAPEIDKNRLVSASCPSYVVSAGVCSCFRLGGERSILLSYRRIDVILAKGRLNVNTHKRVWRKNVYLFYRGSRRRFRCTARRSSRHSGGRAARIGASVWILACCAAPKRRLITEKNFSKAKRPARRLLYGARCCGVLLFAE